jgi:ATP-dependent exoDNAse (exonuclease V) beta subunit
VLGAPELKDIWARPAEATEVWRERSFEMIWDEAWVTGTMDRVIITRGTNGGARRATVYDFKTDRIEADQQTAAVRKHDGQMRLYRQAVARLTGLPESAVDAAVVFTRLRRVVSAGR